MSNKGTKKVKNIDKLSLAKIWVAFIDFDDTAVIHLVHNDWPDWFNNNLIGVPDSYFRNNRTAPMPGMKEFLDELMSRDIDIYCLTASDSSLVVEPKKAVLDTYYGEGVFKKVISCHPREYKIRLIQEYAHNNELAPRSILVVDDHPETIYECRKLGFTVATPQEICIRYYASNN